MADVTVLRCWPACVEAIDWSPDGIIALASDERVELLFPNTVEFERDQAIPQWQHVPLKAPLFSTDELPLKEAAPLSTYSIGEEISNSAPIRIAWSPPGLAKHRRCALAALTANLALSIWSAEGKPQEQSSWSRRLIVNDALTEYFKDSDDEPSHLMESSKERLRLRTRIRTFAWAPPLPCPELAGVVGTRLSYGQHVLAVANDDNHIIFMLIESPTSTLGVERGWRAEVLSHDSFAPDSESIFSNPTCFEDLMRQQRYISHIAWSPWVARSDRYQSVVVYATNHDVRAKIVTYTHNSIGLGEEVVYTGFELRYDGPLAWCPQLEDGDKLKLALFTKSGLVYLTISAHDASIIQRTVHDLDGRWDQISGVVWDTAADVSPRLHLSSLLSTLHSPTAVLNMSSEKLQSLGTPSWREQIENNLALFSVKNELKGNSRTKVWGLTSSPLGDYIAACNSVHPSDMIEYGIPADRSGTVAITSLRHGSQPRPPFPKMNVSAEGLSWTLKKLAEDAIEDPDELPGFAEDLVEKLCQVYAPAPNAQSNISTSPEILEGTDIGALTTMFKKTAFLDPDTLKDRYKILVSYACTTGSPYDLAKALVAYRLATALKRLPPPLWQTPFSAEIYAQHKQLITLINSVMKSDSADDYVSAESAASDSAGDVIMDPETNGDQGALHQGSAADGWTDTCDFCSASIPFTDLTSAACTNGHQFPRCGLSFLAIQAPHITKYCGICSTPFLSDEFIMAQEYVDRTKIAEAPVEGDAVMTDAAENREAGTNGDKRQTEERGANEGGEGALSGLDEPQQNPTSDETGKQSNDNTTAELDDEEVKRDLPVTLARVLFLACDACIYCGGKFVG